MHNHSHDAHQHSKSTPSQSGHAHHNHANPRTHGRAFALAIVLNTIFVVLEFTYGFIANSTALMADAGHNLSDVLGLALAWIAAVLAAKAPTSRFTYGLGSSSTLAALGNAALLLVSCGAIGWEALHRFWETPVINTTTVMVVATIGIAINVFSALLFMRGSKDDLNIRGAYLHMAADALVSLGVVVAAAIISITGWMWLDPLVSLLIVAVIIRGTWGLLKESLQLALHAVPQTVDIAGVEKYLRNVSGVSDIHDLHIWGMSTTDNALTVHLVMPNGYPGDKEVDAMHATLNESFKIQHATIQIERGDSTHICSVSK